MLRELSFQLRFLGSPRIAVQLQLREASIELDFLGVGSFGSDYIVPFFCCSNSSTSLSISALCAISFCRSPLSSLFNAFSVLSAYISRR